MIVAGLDVRLGAGRAEFLEGDAALGLQADIDDGEFVGEAEDAAGDDGAVEAGIAAEGFIEQGGEVLAAEMVLGRGRRDGAGGGGCCHMEVVFRYGCPGVARGLPWFARFAGETRLARGRGPRAGLRIKAETLVGRATGCTDTRHFPGVKRRNRDDRGAWGPSEEIVKGGSGNC